MLREMALLPASAIAEIDSIAYDKCPLNTPNTGLFYINGALYRLVWRIVRTHTHTGNQLAKLQFSFKGFFDVLSVVHIWLCTVKKYQYTALSRNRNQKGWFLAAGAKVFLWPTFPSVSVKHLETKHLCQWRCTKKMETNEINACGAIQPFSSSFFFCK